METYPLFSTIQVNNEEYTLVKETDCCVGCAFYKPELDSGIRRYCRIFEEQLGECASGLRTDEQGIIFIKKDVMSDICIKGRSIGNVFQVKNEFLKVIEQETCVGCYFCLENPDHTYSCTCDKDIPGPCAESFREDKTSVIFINIEEVYDNS